MAVSLGAFFARVHHRLLTEKYGVYVKGLSKVLNLLGLIGSVPDHELPEANINTGDKSRVQSGLVIYIQLRVGNSRRER